MAEHPMQPLERDNNGVVRFKANAIVRYLLDLCTEKGIANMNTLAIIPFSQEDRQQFSQLIGYSVCGYCDLSYNTEESKDVAWDQMNAMPKGETDE